jgi:ABC-2 type transport system permease protein
MPIIFTLVLAGGTGGGSSDNRVRLVVADRAGSPLSAQLITALDASGTVRPDVLPLSAAENEFSQRNTPALLTIPPDFDLAHVAAGSVQLELRQLPNDLNALAAGRAVDTAATRLASAVDAAKLSTAEAARLQPFGSAQARRRYLDASLQAAQTALAQAPARLTVVQGASTDVVEYDPRANSSAGQLLTWAFVPLLGISGTFAYERQRGTLRRLLTTPTSRGTYLLGAIFGQVAVALVQMLLLVLFGMFAMRLNWGHAPLALAAILVTSVLAGAALGTALGTIIKSEGQANGLSWMLGMVLAMLGGCWYPIELFPQTVRSFAHILPTYWAMQGMLNIVLRGQGLAGVLTESGVLLGFAALFFGIGVWRFRYE